MVTVIPNERAYSLSTDDDSIGKEVVYCYQ